MLRLLQIDTLVSSIQAEASVRDSITTDDAAAAESSLEISVESVLASLKELYSMLDVDNNRLLSCTELMLLMTVLYGHDNQNAHAARTIAVKEAIEAYDRDGSGDLTFVEFVELICSDPLFVETLNTTDDVLKESVRRRAASQGWDGLGKSTNSTSS